MLIVRSANRVPIRLTAERWRHISQSHPEMAGLRDWVLETVSEPEMVLEGDQGELLAVRFYPSTPLTSKYLVVPYREIGSEDGFVLTAYLATRRASWRPIVWRR